MLNKTNTHHENAALFNILLTATTDTRQQTHDNRYTTTDTDLQTEEGLF